MTAVDDHVDPVGISLCKVDEIQIVWQVVTDHHRLQNVDQDDVHANNESGLWNPKKQLPLAKTTTYLLTYWSVTPINARKKAITERNLPQAASHLNAN